MTKTEIANIALAKFREGRITTIESTTDPVAVVMNDQYDHALELLLEEHRWNFAGKRVTLTQLSDDPPFGWDHQYALPSDCIRLKDVNGEDVEASSKLFTLEGRNLLTNDDTVTITYVAKIIDTNFYSPSFVEALTFKLASITCGRLTGDTDLAIMLDKQYNYALSKAIHNDTKAAGSREHNLMQRMMNSSTILGGSPLSGTGYTRTASSTSGTVAAHKHELTDLLATGATDGQTIIWNDTDQIWEAGDAAAGGDVSTDTIFDAAGDLVVGTGADTAAKLPIGANGLVLKSNGTTAVWDAIAGTGDVVGDSSSTDNAITRFDGTTGKAIQNSGASIDDTGNLTANNFTGSSSGANTGDQDLSTYQLKPSEGAFVNGDKTKLDAITGSNTGDEVQANQTTAGIAEVATPTEINTGTLDTHMVTPLGLAGSQLQTDVTANNAKVTNATHTGEVTGSTALTIANRTGADAGVVTGTAGTSGNLAQWNVDGDAVDSALATADVVTGSSTDTLTNKTIDGTGNTITNVSLTTGVTGDLPYANLVPATAISKLVGRGAAAGAGDMEEITLGTGLTMVGTTLSSTGGGGGSVSELSDLSDVNTSTPTNRNALIADGVDFESRALVEADISDLGTYLASTDIDTLAELNAIVGDATLIDTADARLSDSRTPTTHAASHTDGTDDIQSATNAVKGLATAAQITAIEANTAASHAAATKSGTGTYVTLSAQDIVVDPIDPADLSATGTPSVSTYLRGDNTWATVSGSGDVVKVGTPVDNEIGVWTGDGTLEGDTNFTWDGSTLDITGGAIISKTATQADEHGVEINYNAAGFGDAKALDIVYTTGAIVTGQDEASILVNIDETAATGGSVFGLEVLTTDGAADKVCGMKVGAVVAPICQESGTFANPTTGTNNTASTDVAAMIDGSTGTNTNIFVADNDYIIIGAAAAFTEIEFILQTLVSTPGITPTFAYSTAGAGQFTTFSPTDGTNGFTNNGVVAWNAGDLTGHTTNDDTGTFDIKITRTNNTKGNASLYYAKTAATVSYQWDESGVVTVASAIVDDEAYSGSWDASLEVPTKNAIYDKIESLEEVLGFACSDETTALTTGEKVKLDIPFDFLVTRVFATLATAGTTSATTVDVQDETVSILNAVVSITQATNNAETSTFASAATEYQLTKGDALSIDINAVDSGATDAGLKVFLEGVRT